MDHPSAIYEMDILNVHLANGRTLIDCITTLDLTMAMIDMDTECEVVHQLVAGQQLINN